MQKLKLGILGSGKGSNFRAILEAIRGGDLDAEVAIVVSDRAEAGILPLASDAGLPTATITDPHFKTKLSHDIEIQLVSLLKKAQVDLVVLAGYMRMIKSPLLDAYPRRIINIHPSLLPKFPGLNAWQQAISARDSVSGCTVHFVDSGMDSGEIIAQSEVPILPDDTAESLHARIQQAEHVLYPAIIKRFVRGELP